jgi:adenylate kinase
MKLCAGAVWRNCLLVGIGKADDYRSRKYPEAKLQENLDAEIMEVILQEAHEAFDEQIVIELTSNTSDEMETNLERIEQWIKQWKVDNAEDGKD